MQLSSKQREAISKAIDDHVEGTLGFRYEVLDAIERIVSGPHTAQRGFIGPDSPDAPAPAPLALRTDSGYVPWHKAIPNGKWTDIGFDKDVDVVDTLEPRVQLADGKTIGVSEFRARHRRDGALHVGADWGADPLPPAPLADAERAELSQFRAIRDNLGDLTDVEVVQRIARVERGE
jgi:hypothetical protein